MADPADTIFAHSSGRPPAAIAVIRISGEQAHAAAATLAGTLPPSRVAALRKLRTSGGELLDEALVLRFDGPATATGEDLVEFHCHGGRAVVSAVLAELGTLTGLRQALPGEFTRRALTNGRIDLTEAGGLADLLEAETEQQRRAALAVAGGALRRQVEDWRARVVELSAVAEAAIDYVGDEDETAIDVGRLQAGIGSLVEECQAWLARPRSELIRQGVRVVLAGPPNAGKSSLLNALVGHDRAIVSELAGTTRDVIEVPVVLEGIAFVLVDTAGLRSSGDTVEQIGVGLAKEQASLADILVWLGDPQSCPTHPRVIRLHAQADRRELVPGGGLLAVSSVTGQGLPRLQREIVALAQAMLPVDGAPLLNRQQASSVEEIVSSLLARPDDLLLIAEALRHARLVLDKLTGRAGMDDVLDALFGRFCLGK